MDRTFADVKQSFDRVAAVLDAALADARPRLAAQSIAIEEHSNRSGRDMSGYPYCYWWFWFEKRYAHGSEIASASARVEYFEPIGDEPSEPQLRVESIADIYQTGQQSRVKERIEELIPLEGVDLHELVLRLIGHATALLMQHGVTPDTAPAAADSRNARDSR